MRGNVEVKKTYFSLICTLVWLFLIPIKVTYGQLTPPLMNFHPNEYKGGNQIWNIAQNKEGDVFFANHDQLLRYNGHQWEVLKIEKPTIFRTVYALEDQILSGGLMEFGLWTKNEYGTFEYESLAQKMNIEIIDGESFWNIVAYKGYLVFQSFNRALIIDSKLKSYQQIYGDFNNNSLVTLEGKPFLIDLQKGLLNIFEDSQSYHFSSEINWSSIVGTIRWQQRNYLVSNNGSLYQWEKNLILPQKNLRLPKENIYSLHQMKTGVIVLGTIGDGIVWLDDNLKIDGALKRSNGLGNNTILSLFEDHNSNLWAGMDRGIALVNISSPHLEHRNSSKDIGSVYTAIEWNNTIYIGTNQGLYYLNSELEAPEKIKGIEGQIWKLDLIDNDLYCSSNSGLFQVKDPTTIRTLSEDVGFWGVQKEGKHLIGGTYEGIYVYDFQNGNPILKTAPETFKVSSRFIEVKDEKVYINNEYLGVFVLEFDNDFSQLTNQWTIEKNGLKSALFQLDDQVYYKSSEGIYTIDLKSKAFRKDSLLTQLLEPEDLISSGFIRGGTKNLIGFKAQSIYGIQRTFIENTYTSFEYELPPYVYENLGNSGFENINHLSDERYLIGLSDGFVILDLEYLTGDQLEVPTIDNVQQLIQNSWVTKPLIPDNSKQNFKNNSMRFYLKKPSYAKYAPMVFQTELLRDGALYSMDRMRSELEFINLEPGAYEFQVIVFDPVSKKSNISASYSFIIDKPWFLKEFIQILFSLLILVTLFLAFYFTRRTYKKRELELKLKNQKKLDILQLKEKERINKIHQKNLENQLKTKKRELTISTEHLLSKNRLLHQLSKKINEVEKKHQIDLSSLHEFINNNIKEKKDWNRFEKALADYDEDFVKRIKNQFYGTISRQDFLLMTYIRGGMNSKDIAQVLGISVKSVEMRRYRLRKKIGLNEEVSLSDYINNL